jgi:hypothetical protein
MRQVRRLFRQGLAQYEIRPKEFADHICRRGMLVCLNEPEQSIPCPCRGKTPQKLADWARRIEDRSLPAQTVFEIFCIVNATRKAIAWREGHDPGADRWIWDTNRAYLGGASYAGPTPLELPEFRPAVAIAPKNGRRLANELTNEIQRKGFNKVTRARLQLAIEQFLEKRRELYADSFVTWFSCLSAYRVVVRDRERIAMVVRTGPASSKTYQVAGGNVDYEVHHSHLAPRGDRDPRPEEIVMVALTRNMEEEATANAKRRTHAKGAKAKG